MASEWREKNLDQLGRIVTGKTPPSTCPEHFGGIVPFVTPTDFDGRRIIDTTARYLTLQGAESIGNCRLPSRAVMVSCIGSDMGKVAIAGNNCVTNQQINSIVIESSDDPLFVYYNLSLRKTEIRIAAGGSAQPILNKSAFGRLSILLPEANEQKAVARILGTLDDKIELNRKRNETLEAMARALFQSWFVDFDPVRAKAEGRDPGLPADIAALFPDSFEPSELGPIPSGWRVKSIGDLAEVKSGKRPNERFPQPSSEASVPLWGGNGPMAYVTTHLYNQPILLTGRVGTLGSVFRIATPCWPSDNTLILIPIEQHGFEFLFIHLGRIDFSVFNRGSTQPLLTQTDLKSSTVIVPPQSLLGYFHKVARELFTRHDKSADESSTLAALRDTLLPKLISGELRLRAAENLMEMP
jgi:type I restriction enzyme S subunit